MKRKIRRFIKKREDIIIAGIIFFIILILVSIGGGLLIKNGKDYIVITALFVFILWTICLYIQKGEIKERYKQLLHFAHKFYKKEKKGKADEYDFEDYNLSAFEDEFENWLRDKKIKKYFK